MRTGVLLRADFCIQCLQSIAYTDLRRSVGLRETVSQVKLNLRNLIVSGSNPNPHRVFISGFLSPMLSNHQSASA